MNHFPKLIIALMLCILITGCTQKSSSSEVSISSIETSSSESSSEMEIPKAELYPTDKFFVTEDRIAYKDETLVLKVPRLDLETKIVGEISKEDAEAFSGGTMTAQQKSGFLSNINSDELLTRGVMIFNLSQLPNNGNANVTLSGHRDIYGKEFYYLHEIVEGDMIYLQYQGLEYVYEYNDTIKIKSTDWTPLHCKEWSAVTLISCDPIGTSLNRIVVTGKLVEVRKIV